jgi:hypothetical protein
MAGGQSPGRGPKRRSLAGSRTAPVVDELEETHERDAGAKQDYAGDGARAQRVLAVESTPKWSSMTEQTICPKITAANRFSAPSRGAEATTLATYPLRLRLRAGPTRAPRPCGRSRRGRA